MRMMLALGILVMMLGVAGVPTCDSGGVARAQEVRPVPHVGSDWLMRGLRLLTEDYHRRHALEEFDPQQEHERRQALGTRNPQPASERRRAPEEYNPDVERERRREFRRGDFWTPKDFNRTFQDLDRGFRPGR